MRNFDFLTQSDFQKILIVSYEIYQANHIQLELESLDLNGKSATEYLEKRFFEMGFNNTNLSVDFVDNNINETVDLNETA